MAFRPLRLVGWFSCLVVCGQSMASVADAAELRRRGVVGVQLAPVPAAEGEGAAQASKGVLLAAVVPGGAADAAGLQANDIVVKIGDAELTAVPDFSQALRSFYAGDKVPFTIQRGKETLTKEVVLAERPRETSDLYEVMYESVEVNGLRLRSYVTRPQKSEGKRPAVLLIPSPGTFPMELGPQMANHPYRKLIDTLTHAGLVTMRVDRAGVGESDGLNPMETDLAMDAESFRNAARKLATYDFVDADRVFIYAFGMGSAIAPLAAKDSGVRGVALYGSTIARTPTESLPEALGRMWWLYDPDDKEIDQKVKLATKYVKLCAEGTKPGEALRQCDGLREAMQRFSRQGERDDHVAGIYHPYFLNICRTDYAKAWGEVGSEVLVLWGEADYQANRKDSEFIAEAVNKKHSGRATFKTLPKCDHVGNKADDPEDSFLTGYSAGEFNPALVETLVNWMEKLGGGKA